MKTNFVHKILSVLVITAAIGTLASCGKKSSSDNSVDPYNTQLPNGQYPGGQYPGGVQPPTTNPCGGCGYTPPTTQPCGGCGYVPPPVQPPCGGCGDCWDWDDCDPTPPVQTFDTGYIPVWSTFQQCVEKSVTVTIPSAGQYFLSFKGTYTGYYERQETLDIKINNGTVHHIVDLDQDSGNPTVKKCKVPVTYQINTPGTYTIKLIGNGHDVTNANVRVTDFYPSDITRTCNQ